MTWALYSFDTVSSTMDRARDMLAENKQTPYAVMAKEQTQGRGRRQRSWTSCVGNLYVTLGLSLENTQSAPLFSYLTAVTVRDTLGFFLGPTISATLKWPNDLLVDSKKVGGILLELATVPQGVFLLIGIGVNLMNHPQDTPYPATHLGCYISPPSAEHFLDTLLTSFDQWHSRFQKEGFEPIRQKWLNHRDPAHKHLCLRAQEHGTPKDIQGAFHDLDPKGALILECTEKGKATLKKFHTGDVFFS